MGLIAVFDFDGTLIKDDSMVLFFRRYYKYSWKNTGIPLILAIEAIKFFLKISSQKQFKEKFINIVIRSSKNRGLEEIIPDFPKFLLKKILKDAISEIGRLKEKGYEIIMISASLDFYLKEIARVLGFSKLICTQTSFKDGKITITGENCYGKNKILRLMEQYSKDSTDWKNSYCFSDNSSDSGLLSLFGNAIAVNNYKLAAKTPGFKHLVWK